MENGQTDFLIKLFRSPRDCRLEQGQRGPRHQSLADRFRDFHRDNPHVFEAIIRVAEDQRRGGAKRVSVKFIIESLRRDRRLATEGERWKINNSFASYYARELIARLPVYRDLIELREQS